MLGHCCSLITYRQMGCDRGRVRFGPCLSSESRLAGPQKFDPRTFRSNCRRSNVKWDRIGTYPSIRHTCYLRWVARVAWARIRGLVFRRRAESNGFENKLEKQSPKSHRHSPGESPERPEPFGITRYLGPVPLPRACLGPSHGHAHAEHFSYFVLVSLPTG